MRRASTARPEGFIVGRPNLAEIVTRLAAFGQAGADCLPSADRNRRFRSSNLRHR